jgi:hypothetical protein
MRASVNIALLALIYRTITDRGEPAPRNKIDYLYVTLRAIDAQSDESFANGSIGMSFKATQNGEYRGVGPAPS